MPTSDLLLYLDDQLPFRRRRQSGARSHPNRRKAAGSGPGIPKRTPALRLC